MSRSGMSDDCDDQWAMIMWAGAQKSAINGKRGQAFLKEMLIALDALPEKRLIPDELIASNGEVCAIGSVAKLRGVDLSGVSPDDWQRLSKTFNISETLVRVIEYENDDEFGYRNLTPEERFAQFRRWVVSQIKV